MISSVSSMIDQFNMPNICLMLDMGYEVHVACNFEKGNTCSAERVNKLKAALSQMHVICHQWDCPRSMQRAGDFIRAFWQLWDLTGRHRFEWMHCHSPIGSVLARAVACRRGIRVIYTAHGFHFYKGAPLKNWLLFYPVEKMLAHVTDVLITINKEDYLFARKKLKAGKICYTPGVGIDTERFRRQPGAEGGVCQDSEKQKHAAGFCGCPGAEGTRQDSEKGKRHGEQNAADTLRAAERKKFCRKYKIPVNAVILLSAGELNRGKNHRMVIGAMAGMSRTDVYYLICGLGGLKEELLKYADSLNVRDRIRMPGYQENMPWFYQNADIFVFPSVREGMPVALAEAMAAGLPCVVSDIRGSRQLISDKDMRFCLGRQDQLGRILETLASSSYLRQKYGAENQVSADRYNIENVKKRMKKIYCYCSGLCCQPQNES